MKVDCPVGDQKILWHLFQQVSVQQKLYIYAVGKMKNLKE